MRSGPKSVLAIACVSWLTACGAETPGASPSPTPDGVPSASPGAAPSATPSAAPPSATPGAAESATLSTVRDSAGVAIVEFGGALTDLPIAFRIDETPRVDLEVLKIE